MVRNTIMEKNQHIQRWDRSPVMISSPGYPTAIIAADVVVCCDEGHKARDQDRGLVFGCHRGHTHPQEERGGHH